MTRTRALLLAGFLLALVLAGGVGYYASRAPDGLTEVAADQGFEANAQEHPLAGSPVAGYQVRGVPDGRLSGGLARVLGVVTTLAIGGALFKVVTRRRDATDPEPEPAARR
ncbi:MAG: PDGLE domain-containing protein [Mycobacteriales bacterium]